MRLWYLPIGQLGQREENEVVSRLGRGYDVGGLLGVVLRALVALLILCRQQQGTRGALDGELY